MVGSLLLYKIHNRLQEITGSCLGEFLVVGDFFQIIPVGDSCLYKDIIKYIVLQNDDKIMKIIIILIKLKMNLAP
jgi:hypothetical protein